MALLSTRADALASRRALIILYPSRSTRVSAPISRVALAHRAPNWRAPQSHRCVVPHRRQRLSITRNVTRIAGAARARW